MKEKFDSRAGKMTQDRRVHTFIASNNSKFVKNYCSLGI